MIVIPKIEVHTYIVPELHVSDGYFFQLNLFGMCLSDLPTFKNKIYFCLASYFMLGLPTLLPETYIYYIGFSLELLGTYLQVQTNKIAMLSIAIDLCDSVPVNQPVMLQFLITLSRNSRHPHRPVFIRSAHIKVT